MSKRNTKGKAQYDQPRRSCFDCANAEYIGEGDFICDACGEPALVMENYIPAEGFRTGCREWEER